jgi:hypothetical protein
MTRKFLSFVRAHEFGATKEARSPWVCLTIQSELNLTPVPDLAARFHNIRPTSWQGSFDPRYNGWQQKVAAARGDDEYPAVVFELLFVADKAIADMTREQAIVMVAELSRNTFAGLTWHQEQDRAAAILGFRPSSDQAARTHYRKGPSFMRYMDELVANNKPDDPCLLKFAFNPRLLEPQPTLQERPTGAMRELAIPVEDTPVQEQLRARTRPGRNRQAFIEHAYLRMMAAKKRQPA